MARPLRIQYPGALYHVMARGSRGQVIFLDDQDRKRFLETLGEACQKTGWVVHVYVLMRNHYHILVETPEGNLVAGMKWLQGTYTQRYNTRHKVVGHLFQGRYKAVVVEVEEPKYLQVASTYIHLNPARAGLIRIGEERLKRYRWSSYPWYLTRGGRKPNWLCRERVMGSLGLAEKEAHGYEVYVEARVLELGLEAGRNELEEQWKELRRGWYAGSDSFGQRLKERLHDAMRGLHRESHSGPAKNAHDQAAAERSLKKALRVLGLDEQALEKLPNASLQKVALAWWLRENTTVTLRWVSERLGMGHYTRVTQAVRRMNKSADRKLDSLKRKLLTVQ